MQKYQGNSTNAPRETFINDQRHMLAYINPFEEDLLRNYGGTGQAGPGGVPAFRPVRRRPKRRHREIAQERSRWRSQMLKLNPL
jgi:hypothetical protein